MSGSIRSIRGVVGAVVLVVAGCVVAGLASGLLVSVVTDGTSMLPSHQAGDLVVVARTGGYDVGQVVAYRDEASSKIVLHRIVGGDEHAFEMRGDNNTSIDPTHPAADDLLGRELLHVPKVGVVFRTPAGLALVLGAAVLVGGLLVGGRRDRTGEIDHAETITPRRRRAVLVRALIVVADLAVIGGIVATFVIRPHTVVPPPVPEHTGSLSYVTEVPVDEVYPTGLVSTGDPVFLRLVDRLDVVFRYHSEASAGTQASARVRAELTDGSGWSRTFDVAALTPVLGDSLELTGSLDLAGMQALVERVTAATGMPAGPLGLVVTAEVDLTIDGHPSTFSTRLPLSLNQLVLRVGSDVALVDPDGDGTREVTITGPVDSATGPAEPYETGGMPAFARKVLFALLIVMLAVTVVSWPAPPSIDEPSDAQDVGPPLHRLPLDEEPLPEPAAAPQPTRAPTVAVGRLVLPSGVMLVDVTDEDGLHRLAVANQVPVFVGDDGTSTVITGLAVHRWRAPAETPTVEQPVVGRRLFPDARPDAPAPAGRDLDAVVRYLGDPVVNHRAAASAPLRTRTLRHVQPDEGSPGLT